MNVSGVKRTMSIITTSPTDAAGEMRGAGITGAGMDADLDASVDELEVQAKSGEIVGAGDRS